METKTVASEDDGTTWIFTNITAFQAKQHNALVNFIEKNSSKSSTPECFISLGDIGEYRHPDKVSSS